MRHGRALLIAVAVAAVVVATAAGVTSGGVVTPDSLQTQDSHFTLGGRAFFPVVADEYSLPDQEWVTSVAALGANALFLHDHGCPSFVDLPNVVNAANTEHLLWITKGDCAVVGQIANGVKWPAGVVALANPFFGSCSGLSKFKTTLGVFDAIRRAARTQPVIWQTWIAKELVPGSPMCLTGRSATALFWTVVAAGGAGIEYYAFVPARFTNTDNIDRTDVAADVASAAASFSSQIQSLAQPILTGERLTLTPLSDTPVRIGAWRFNGKTYIVAVNTSASRATLALATRATVARVLFEARILRVAKRRLRDSFLPFAVHIYVVG